MSSRRLPASSTPTSASALALRVVGAAMLLLLVAAGCADADSDGQSEIAADAGVQAQDGDQTAPAETPTAAAPSQGEPAIEGSPASDSSPPTPVESATSLVDGEVSGTLGGSDIEGGCVWLDADDGTRYELLTPTSTDVVVDPSRLALITPSGDVIARVGDDVVVTGTVDEGIMTFCQVGVNLAITAARLA